MKSIILFLIFSFAGQFSYACLITTTLNESEKAKADIVFEGKLTSYKYIKSSHVAILSFDVLKTIRGKKQKKWSVVFSQNTNVTVPLTIDEYKKRYGPSSIVGIRKNSGSDGYTGSLVNAPKGYKEQPILVQTVCSEPYLESIGK